MFHLMLNSIGPLSNLAEALQINPAIAKNIGRIFIMVRSFYFSLLRDCNLLLILQGGAVRVTGNVRISGMNDLISLVTFENRAQ